VLCRFCWRLIPAIRQQIRASEYNIDLTRGRIEEGSKTDSSFEDIGEMPVHGRDENSRPSVIACPTMSIIPPVPDLSPTCMSRAMKEAQRYQWLGSLDKQVVDFLVTCLPGFLGFRVFNRSHSIPLLIVIAVNQIQTERR
jgi:hypothetical protein